MKHFIRAVQTQAITQLQDVGIQSARFEVRQLLCHVLQVTVAKLLCLDEVDDQSYQQFQTLVARRATGYPLQYLIGQWDFYGRSYAVGDGVLIPRADTEILCEVALAFLQTRVRPSTLDLCAGSGCIAITLEKEHPHDRVVAVELMPQALEFLLENVKQHDSQVQVLQDDVLTCAFARDSFDLILSNPPYLNEDDMAHLQTEVTHEPQTALFAEENGYLFYKTIPVRYFEALKIGGMLCFEVGIGQADTVANIMTQQGFSQVKIYPDLQGIDRVVTGIKQG